MYFQPHLIENSLSITYHVRLVLDQEKIKQNKII